MMKITPPDRDIEGLTALSLFDRAAYMEVPKAVSESIFPARALSGIPADY
jgi:hypothetical protein